MSHFSDIGFRKFEDKTYFVDVMNEILAGKFGAPEVQNAEGRMSLHIYSLGKIRYVFLIDDKKDEVIDYEIGHQNERLSFGTGAKFMDETSETAFFNMQVEKDGIPFCFACLNTPVSDLRGRKEDEVVQFSVASFANDIEVLSEDELPKSKWK